MIQKRFFLPWNATFPFDWFFTSYLSFWPPSKLFLVYYSIFNKATNSYWGLSSIIISQLIKVW